MWCCSMGRKAAYALIASLGFVVGVIIYAIGLLVVPWLIENFPSISISLALNRQIVEALISGVVGSILSIIIVYIWASKSS